MNFWDLGEEERKREREERREKERKQQGMGNDIWGFVYMLIYVLLKLPAVFSV